MEGPTHFSVFTGIAGIDVAAEWAGFRTVGMVELADFPFGYWNTGSPVFRNGGI